MPAHLKQNKFGVFYRVDGYLNKSLKTKTKRYAEARLRQYLDGRYNVGAIPTVQKYYDSWIEQKVPPLVRHSQVETTSKRLRRIFCRDSKTCAYPIST